MNSDTVAIAMNLMDRYLSVVESSTRLLELLAMICIFVASKINERTPIKLVSERNKWIPRPWRAGKHSKNCDDKNYSQPLR